MLPLLSLASNNSPGSNSSSTFLQIKFVRSRLPGGRTDRWTLRVLSSSDRKSTRLNSSHLVISYAVFCLKKKIPRDVAADEDADKVLDENRPSEQEQGPRQGLCEHGDDVGVGVRGPAEVEGEHHDHIEVQ